MMLSGVYASAHYTPPPPLSPLSQTISENFTEPHDAFPFPLEVEFLDIVFAFAADDVWA